MPQWDEHGNPIEEGEPQARPRRTWDENGNEVAPRAAAPTRPQQPRVSTGEDVLRSGATGVRRGVVGTVTAPRDLRDLFSQGVDWLVDQGRRGLGESEAEIRRWREEQDMLRRDIDPRTGERQRVEGLPDWLVNVPDPIEAIPTFEQANEGVQRRLGRDWEPQTTAGEYARTVGEFAPAIVAPGRAAERVARTVVPAVTSETAGQITEGTPYEAPARILGALVGSGGTEVAMSSGRSAARRDAARVQEWNDQADARALEQDFGPMTRGERAADPAAMQRESSLRRAGPAQEIMHDFDNARAERVQDSLMRRIATRGQEPTNPDLGSAGTALADDLRTQFDAMQTERTARYNRALTLAADEKIAPTDELLNNVLNSSREHFGKIDSPSVGIIRELHSEIAQGQATYARLERARQALNEELGDAMRSGSGREVIAIHRIIDDLDAFAAPRVSPEARRALEQAREYSREMSSMYGQNLRPELSSGHTGRRDPGGSVIRNIVETDLTGEQVIDSIFGATTRPPQSTLGAVQRIKDRATETIQYTNRSAASGERTPNRPRRGGRTAGARRFNPTPAEQARFGTELPKSDLQALREAFVYRLRKPIDNRTAGDAIPARTMARSLRQSLHGPGAEITRIIFNEAELNDMNRALRFLEQVSPPSGSYAPSAPGIAQDLAERSFAALASRLIGKLPGGSGIAEGIREGVVNARAVKDARDAIAPPVAPRPPRRIGAPLKPEAAALQGVLAAQSSQDEEPPRRLGGRP